MKIFLTGAAGFIGSHVARLLVKEGHEVHALLKPESDTGRIADILPALRIVCGNLLERDTWEKPIERIQPEMAFHFAWFAEPGQYLESLKNIPLLQASLQLAEKLAQIGCKKFLAAGSCFEYDTSFGRLSESSPVKPETLYAASKLTLCFALEQLSRSAKMTVAWLRFFYLYGPYENEMRFVPTAILSLLSGQHVKTVPGQSKDFLHVEDAARAVLAVAKSSLTGAVNIGSGQAVSLDEIARKIDTLLERPELVQIGVLPARPWDPPLICADIRKLLENTDWKPQFSLEDGLWNTTEWWRKRISSMEHTKRQS